MVGFYLSLLDTEEEKSKFEQLYLKYRQDMYKAAFGILKNEFESEDAVHEAFMRVIKKLTNISEINCPQTHAYLIIIVRNIALKMAEENNKTISVDVDSIEITDKFDLEEDVISKMEVERIKHILKGLPEDYYDILFLELFMEFSISDIAEQLNITYDNAKKRLQRARRKFLDISEGDI